MKHYFSYLLWEGGVPTIKRPLTITLETLGTYEQAQDEARQVEAALKVNVGGRLQVETDEHGETCEDGTCPCGGHETWGPQFGG